MPLFLNNEDLYFEKKKKIKQNNNLMLFLSCYRYFFIEANSRKRKWRCSINFKNTRTRQALIISWEEFMSARDTIEFSAMAWIDIFHQWSQPGSEILIERSVWFKTTLEQPHECTVQHILHFTSVHFFFTKRCNFNVITSAEQMIRIVKTTRLLLNEK